MLPNSKKTRKIDRDIFKMLPINFLSFLLFGSLFNLNWKFLMLLGKFSKL